MLLKTYGIYTEFHRKYIEFIKKIIYLKTILKYNKINSGKKIRNNIKNCMEYLLRNCIFSFFNKYLKIYNNNLINFKNDYNFTKIHPKNIKIEI